jgi:DNA-binding transcriptional regulator/RsmH inhibitor MraZ
VETNGPISIAPEAPLGIFQAKCDEKGRLKLPAEFATYLKGLSVDKVFITTIDLRQARIYPKSVWESNRNLLDGSGDDTEMAEDVSFVANLYGACSEIDEERRVLIPTELRRMLEFERQPVWLEFFRGRINVMGKKIYDERMQRAIVNLGDKVKALEKKGFK